MVIPSHCMTGELYALSELFFCYLDSVFEPEMHQNYIEFFERKILISGIYSGNGSKCEIV
jgi:hypothetical protein